MLVLINGLSHFGSTLAEALQAMDKKNHYVFLNTYVSKWAQLKFLILLPFARLVISFNGVSSYSGTMERVLKRKKKLIMFWHGTDALMARDRNDNGTINNEYIKNANHYSDAPWLIDELKDILPNSEVLNFKTINVINSYEEFDKLQVLTYVPDGKEIFYGLSWVLESAKKHPEIPFYVMGNTGVNQERLKNVFYLGWVSFKESIELYQASPIFLRLTKHDGNALSIAQALSFGAEVIWTYPHEKGHMVANQVEFQNTFDKLVFNCQLKMDRNIKNIEYVKTNYDKNIVLANFIKKIHGTRKA